MDDINKKLAEWAGFKLVKNIAVPYYIDPNNNTVSRSSDMPNFTQSLDACFKRLVKDNWSVAFNSKEVCLLTIPRAKEVYGSDIIVGKSNQNNPALALCLAIEKLIDEENK